MFKAIQQPSARLAKAVKRKAKQRVTGLCNTAQSLLAFIQYRQCILTNMAHYPCCDLAWGVDHLSMRQGIVGRYSIK